MIAKNKKFLVVNAFADGPFGGNPAAVFTDASGLETDTMQAFSRQLNLIETVFVLPGESSADFRLRYFTPGSEIPIAGHPTIAAWLSLLHHQIIDANQKTKYLQINLAGTQEIEIINQDPENQIVTMKQPPPRFLDSSCSRDEVASVLAIGVEDIEPELPIRAVDTGLGHLIIPVRSLDVLFRIKRQIEPLRKLCQGAQIREAQLFCFESLNKSYDLHTRNLCPREGLEDPACGSGNGALSAYLSKYCWTTKTDFTLKIEQGTIVKMPSVIHTRTIRNNETIEVFVGGTGVVMLEGQFLI